MTVARAYPVRVEATLDPRLSRWLWLAKWLLAMPHYVVLAFLWVAFVVVSVVAFFAILFTGRYPAALFEFNVGVLRWSWRVAYYSYAALGTDRYPPFTLADVPDYPAHLEVAYPAHLSRGLVLVKSWLLAIPHYVLVGIFAGGGLWAAWQSDRSTTAWGPGGLIGLLALVAAVVLAFTGRYPSSIFDFVLGLNRWVLRVAAYAGLMTDQYPPFRLDLGGHEPPGTLAVPAGMPPAVGAPAIAPEVVTPALGWTAGRVVALVAGCVAGLVALGLLGTGGAATWLDTSQRDASGYVTTGSHAFSTSGYALTSEGIDLGSTDIAAPAAVLGTIRIRATATNPATQIFVGIGRRAAVEAYLAGVRHDVVTGWQTAAPRYGHRAGHAPFAAPTVLSIWAASTSGTGTQTVTWTPTSGSWMVVVMHPDARPGISVTADAGATIPGLGWIAAGLLIPGALLAVGAVLLVVLSIVRASRRSSAATPPPEPPASPTS